MALLPLAAGGLRGQMTKNTKMATLTMNIENSKLDIINWIERIHDERIIHKLELLRAEQFDFKHQLTEEQKLEIIRAINTLEEED